MSLNVRASARCSALPSTLARADRSPSATRRAASSSRRTGPATWRAISAPAREAEHEHEQPDGDQPERRAAGGARDGVHALGDAHRADHACPAPHDGTAVARIVSSSVSLRRCSWHGVAAAARRRSPAACRSRCPSRSSPAESATRRPSRSTTITRPRTAAARPWSATLLAVAARSARSTVAATNSAWLSACERTSESTRSRRLMIERDLERDDRQHEHVGERQQKAEAEAYESASGAVNRNPTPRTVCR